MLNYTIDVDRTTDEASACLEVFGIFIFWNAGAHAAGSQVRYMETHRLAHRRTGIPGPRVQGPRGELIPIVCQQAGVSRGDMTVDRLRTRSYRT